MDDALSELYQEIILGHSRRPKNASALSPYDASAEGFNPLCGDQVTVYVRRSGDRVDAVACVCQGCAICRASGSIMTTLASDKTAAEVAGLAARFIDMLTADRDPEADLDTHGELAALAGVRRFPARVKCAALPWHALESALAEGRTDPGP